MSTVCKYCTYLEIQKKYYDKLIPKEKRNNKNRNTLPCRLDPFQFMLYDVLIFLILNCLDQSDFITCSVLNKYFNRLYKTKPTYWYDRRIQCVSRTTSLEQQTQNIACLCSNYNRIRYLHLSHFNQIIAHIIIKSLPLLQQLILTKVNFKVDGETHEEYYYILTQHTKNDSLERLELIECHNVSNYVLWWLNKCFPQITYLSFISCEFTSDHYDTMESYKTVFVEPLKMGCNLKSLIFSECSGMNDVAILMHHNILYHVVNAVSEISKTLRFKILALVLLFGLVLRFPYFDYVACFCFVLFIAYDVGRGYINENNPIIEEELPTSFDMILHYISSPLLQTCHFNGCYIDRFMNPLFTSKKPLTELYIGITENHVLSLIQNCGSCLHGLISLELTFDYCYNFTLDDLATLRLQKLYIVRARKILCKNIDTIQHSNLVRSLTILRFKKYLKLTNNTLLALLYCTNLHTLELHPYTRKIAHQAITVMKKQFYTIIPEMTKKWQKLQHLCLLYFPPEYTMIFATFPHLQTCDSDYIQKQPPSLYYKKKLKNEDDIFVGRHEDNFSYYVTSMTGTGTNLFEAIRYHNVKRLDKKLHKLHMQLHDQCLYLS